MMPHNVGNIDRIVRIVIGLALLSLIFLLDGNARWWGLLGLLPLGSGLMGTCMVYKFLGLSTCPIKPVGKS